MTEENKNEVKKQPVKNTRSNVDKTVKEKTAPSKAKTASSSKAKSEAKGDMKKGEVSANDKPRTQRSTTKNSGEKEKEVSSGGATTLEMGVMHSEPKEVNEITSENQEVTLEKSDDLIKQKKSKRKVGLIAGIFTAVALLGVGGTVAGVMLVKNKPYSISISTEFPNSVTGEGNTYKIGDMVTLKAEPVVGCIFKGWRLNGEIKSEEMEFSFKLTKALAGNWEAVYERIGYSISVNDGAISVVDALTEAGYQDEIKFSVAEKTGYILNRVYYVVEGESAEHNLTREEHEGWQYKFDMPAGNVEIYADFTAIDYNITNITPNDIQILKQVANYEENISVKVDAKTGYSVKAYFIYELNGQNVESEIELDENLEGTFKMPASDISVEARYTEIWYTVRKSAPANGSFKLEKVRDNNSVEITESDDAVGVKDTLKISEILPATGYSVDEIYYIVTGSDVHYPITLTNGEYLLQGQAQNIEIFVTFKKVDYSLSKQPALNGAFELLKDGHAVEGANYGDEITISITPNIGYKIQKVIVNGTEISAENGQYSFEMPASNVSVEVLFEKELYTITLSEGITDLSQEGGAYYGDSITFKVSSKVGYDLSGVQVKYTLSSDGTQKTITPILDGDTYSFDMPNANVKITAFYVVKNYSITNANVDNIIDLVENANFNDVVSFLVDEKEGYKLSVYYRIENVAEKFPITGTDGSYEFTMPAGNVTVYAVYTAKNYTITNFDSDVIIDLLDNANFNELVSFYVEDKVGYDLSVYYIIENSTEKHSITGIDGSYEFSMPAGNITVYAAYTAKSYKINNKNFDALPDLVGEARFNEEIMFSIYNPDGREYKVYYVIEGSTEEHVLDVNEEMYVFTMPAGNISLYAEIVYSVRTNAEHGTFDVLQDDNKVLGAVAGKELTIANIKADTNYEIDEVYYMANGQKTVINLDESATFIMPEADIEVYVTFKIAYFTFTVSEYGGTVDLSCEKAKGGDEVSLSLTKETDSLTQYDLTVMTASGKSVETTTGSDGTITFVMPAENVVINLEYYKRVYAYGTGAICRDGNNELRPGKNITISYTAQTDYTFIGWVAGSENGSIIAQSTSFTSSYDKGLRVHKFYALSCLTASIVTDYEVDGLIYTIYPGTGRCVLTKCDADASSIEIPESIEYNGEICYVFKVENNAFKGKTALREVKFPTGKQFSIIGEYAFSESGITSVDLSYGLTSVGKYAFYKCPNLVNVDLSKAQYAFTITDYMFASSSNLQKVKLPYYVTSISSRAFDSCTSFKGNVENKNGETVLDLREYKFLTSIGGQVFNGCSQITEVYFPLQTCSLGDQVTASCTSLVKVDYGACTANQRGLSAVKDDVANGKVINIYIRETSPAISNAAFNGAYITNLYIESSAVYAQITEAGSLLSTSWGNISGRITNIFIRSDIVDADTTDGGATYGNTYLNDSTIFNIERVGVDGVEFVMYTKI